MTTVLACEKTVVIVKQPGHLTSIKKDLGLGTRVFQEVLVFVLDILPGVAIFLTLSLCLRASAAGVGLRRSTARTYRHIISFDILRSLSSSLSSMKL